MKLLCLRRGYAQTVLVMATLVACGAWHGQPVDALSLEGVQALWNSHTPSLSIDDVAQRVRSIFAVEEQLTSEDEAPKIEKVDEEHAAVVDGALDDSIGAEDVMQAMTTLQAPIIVGAPSCNNGVVLRWKSFADAAWPVERYIVQRQIVGSKQQNQQWKTIIDANVTDVVDRQVEAARHYSYRVQSLSHNNASSAFSYFTVESGAGTCNAPIESWFALPSLVSEWCVSWDHLSFEAAQTLLLLCTCFFTVYSVMRSSVTRVQCTQSRHSRLERIRSATALACSPSVRGVNSMRSVRSTQSTASTDTSSVSTLSLDSSARSRAPAARPSQSPILTRASTAPAVASALERAEACHGCRKKFGIFRRRRICEICRTVALCRKCGFQAPVEQTSEQDLLQSRRNERASSFSSRVERRLVCRDCCTSGVRFSTVSSVRPSIASARPAL